MRLIREEIFGPVGCIIPFDDEDEVLAAANDTEYGLAGAIWTENLGRGHRMANQRRAGQVWVSCALGLGASEARRVSRPTSTPRPSTSACRHKHVPPRAQDAYTGRYVLLV